MGRTIIELKRPEEATPERALALVKAGGTVIELARAWGISRAYVYYLLHRAGWRAKHQ